MHVRESLRMNLFILMRRKGGRERREERERERKTLNPNFRVFIKEEKIFKNLPFFQESSEGKEEST